MKKLNYELVHRLDMHATNKLFDFINTEFEMDNILNTIQLDFPFPMDDGNKLRLNTWISIDYIDEYGKTFIDKFLELKSQNLSRFEEEILLEKSKSFISIFEIINIDEEHMIIHDLLQNKEYCVWEKLINDYFTEGDILFTRIGKLFNEYTFIGDLSFLPLSVKEIFIEEFLYDFNNKRKDEPNLITEEYLKKYSLEIIKIYNHCILSVLEMDDDLNSYLYSQLDEFESYLANKLEDYKIKENISNLIDFFDYFLSPNCHTMNHLKDIDFQTFFKLAVEDGFINSKESLNSYINTFKNYLSYLSKKSSEFTKSYKDIIEISSNRFTLMQNLNYSGTSYSIDKDLAKSVDNLLNEDSITLLLSFDNFLLYMIDNKVEVTPKKKIIKSKYMKELSLIINHIDLSDDLEPSKIEVSILNFFYALALSLGLFSLQNDTIVLNQNGINFINCKDGEKFSLILNYIYNYLADLDIKNKILKLGVDLKDKKAYDIKDIISNYSGNSQELIDVHEYFKLLGLTKTKYYPYYTWEMTKLGKTIFMYYYNMEFKEKSNNVIYLNNYIHSVDRGTGLGKS